MLWYGDRHLLLGKSTTPLVWFNGEPIVQNQDGDGCLICFQCCDVSPRVSSYFSLFFLEDLKLLEGSLVKKFEEISLNCNSM